MIPPATFRRSPNDAHCLVVAVAGRLAPVDDVNRIVEWLSEHAEALGGDPARLALFGDGSGATLAAAASLTASDVYGPTISCQVLVCPVIDFELLGTSMHANAEGYLSERTDLRSWGEHRLVSDGDGLNPCASRARATSLAGLPPTLVITAELDPLREHAEGFGRRLARDGVPSRISRYPGVVHAFDDEPPGQSAAALNEVVAFLSASWTDEPSKKEQMALGLRSNWPGRIPEKRRSKSRCQPPKGNAMHEERDRPAKPEQPGEGGFEEGSETQPDDEHVGQFSEGNEQLPHDEDDVGRFSEGQEELPNEEREGQFSDSVEEEDA